MWLTVPTLTRNTPLTALWKVNRTSWRAQPPVRWRITGGAYNPLFLYGGTGLGKTHLLHAVGNSIMESKANAKVVYMHSERFVQDMVKALQNNAIEEFKRYYRSVDALLIDDIQFFANKERSQEEFFIPSMPYSKVISR